MLQAAGFDWYEVSNWSRSEQTRSAHNLAYWQGQDWWGYGPGAHSHVGGVRWWNLKHPATYAQKLNLQQSPAVGHEVLDEQTRLVERVLLEIRIRDGLEISTVKLANSLAAEPISGFIANGLVEPTEAIKGKIVLTRNGRLLADSMVRDLLA
jgi:oxygen-independent coproporphyrinogen-3 oxidase